MAEELCVYFNIENISIEEEGRNFETQEDKKELSSRSIDGNGHVGASANPVISLSMPNDHDLDAASHSSFESVEIELSGTSNPEDDETSFSINGRSGSSRHLATPSCAGRRYGTHYTV